MAKNTIHRESEVKALLKGGIWALKKAEAVGKKIKIVLKRIAVNGDHYARRFRTIFVKTWENVTKKVSAKKAKSPTYVHGYQKLSRMTGYA